MKRKFNNIPNKPYKAIEDGITRYHSRSVALCGVVILSKGDGEYSLLAHTRGVQMREGNGPSTVDILIGMRLW